MEFRLAAAESGCNDQTLRVTFRRGLSDTGKDQLATQEEPPSLDELIMLTIRIDGQLRERRCEQALSKSPITPQTLRTHREPVLLSPLLLGLSL